MSGATVEPGTVALIALIDGLNEIIATAQANGWSTVEQKAELALAQARQDYAKVVAD